MKEGNSLIALPQQLVEGNIKAAEGKAAMPFWRMALLGVFAGMFIAGGAAASSAAMHAVGNVGLARFIGGCIFPVGLMMIVFIGGEGSLFLWLLFGGPVISGGECIYLHRQILSGHERR